MPLRASLSTLSIYSRLRKSENLQKKQSLHPQPAETDASFSKCSHRQSSETIRHPSAAYLFSFDSSNHKRLPCVNYLNIIISKKLPNWGVWHNLQIFGINFTFYCRFRVTFAEKIPSSTEKSYIPSYLFATAITDWMPMPYDDLSKVILSRQVLSILISSL